MRTNTTEATENRFLGSISASSIRNLLPKSMSTKKKLNSSFSVLKPISENTPPVDPNIQINNDDASALGSKRFPDKMLISQQDTATITSPRKLSVPPDTQLKNEFSLSEGQQEVSLPFDPSVKVVVRIRSPNDGKREGDLKVRKFSSDTLLVGEREFVFDQVFDSKSKQEDIFQQVGVPLVKNALAGYNSSILSYGQIGIGKTYTMWGPPNAMVEGISAASNQGIVPRIFKMLFSKIQKEHENSETKQINYQCRCSFLEVYNEQINDLLDPTQKNLEIKDDAKSGLSFENLTEEYLTSYDDVIQILIKGLSSRKAGATTVNSKSSRSHIVFNFIIESWCKGNSSSFSSSKTSRISFIDLAGLDRNLNDDVDRQCMRETKNLKKSLLRLGHLANSLSNEAHPGKAEDVLYTNSCLTHLLRDSLGGNAKLTVICVISQDNNYIVETLKTLRFGQRLKCVKNKPVINEITEDGVNDLSDQIRQLKEELIRAKSPACSSSMASVNGYFQGRNVRESLNQLRLGLNRSLILPKMDNESDKYVNLDEQDIKELRQRLDKLNSSSESIETSLPARRDSLNFSSAGESFETDSMSDDVVNSPEDETEVVVDMNLDKPQNDKIESLHCVSIHLTSKTIETMIRRSLSINSSRRSPILEDPPLSESPKIGKSQRKSMAISSSSSLCNDNKSENSKFKNNESTELPCQSECESTLQRNKVLQGPTESLAASLQRGLNVIDYHQRNSALIKSSASFSFEHLALKTIPAAPKADSLTFKEVNNGPSSYLCASCRQRLHRNEINAVHNNSKLPLAVVNETADSILLNHLNDELEKFTPYIHMSEDGQESDNAGPEPSAEKLLSLENDKSNSIYPYDEKLQSCNLVEFHQNGFSNVNEKEALSKEFQSLKAKLQSFAACPSGMAVQKSSDKLRTSLLARSIQLRKGGLDFKQISEEELEKERQRWMEMESEWISLTDELRIDLEASRRHAEKVEMELRLEKMCKEELDDAIQRAVLGHARIIEHYSELQENYNELVGKHGVVMEGIAEFKRAAEKAGSKGHGSQFAKCLAAELSAARREREREREFLKKENTSLRIQLRDTAEAVQAAGELLARLREAEESASVAEENSTRAEQENEKLKKQMEKLKEKHKAEMETMKQYLADSRLPSSALKPQYREESEIESEAVDEDQAWRTEFGAIYEAHY